MSRAAIQQYALDTNQVTERDSSLPEPPYDFLVLNSLLYRVNKLTGEAWKLDKNRSWVLIEAAK